MTVSRVWWAPMALGCLLTLGPVAGAQSPTRAVETITEADVRRRIGIIADDSMAGRATPSPGLEATAQYLAAEFRRMGLRPAGDAGGFFQRYGVRVRDVEPAKSVIAFDDGAGGSATLALGEGAKLVFGAPPGPVAGGQAAIGGGAIGPNDRLDRATVGGRALIWAADWRRTPPGLGQVLVAAADGGAALVVLVVNDSAAFERLPGSYRGIVSADQVGWPPVLAVRSETLDRLAPTLSPILAARRADSVLGVSALAASVMEVRLAYALDERHEVPNVIAVVPGTDPALAGEYVAISAHFDHVGSSCRGAEGPDKICNGADDNASGTTGLLELAEAFAHPDARPRRSILFVAVSGEERGLWGSEYFASHPTVPIDRIVADINMDHLGRNWRDSIVVIGREHSDLGVTVDRVAADHPELGVGVLPDQWPEQRIYYRSDHYNFAKRGVPILFFTNGFHADYHAVTDSPDKIDAEKEARVVRLIWHTARAIADETARPRWNPESERQIVRRSPTP